MRKAREVAQKLTRRANVYQEVNSTRKEVNEHVSVECIFCTELYADPPVDDWIMCSQGGLIQRASRAQGPQASGGPKRE